MSQMEDGMTGIFGAIIGDIVGSKYEANPIKTKHFPLFSNGCRFTDDTVMTCAVAEGIMNGGSADDFIDAMKKYGRMYPNAGYIPGSCAGCSPTVVSPSAVSATDRPCAYRLVRG